MKTLFFAGRNPDNLSGVSWKIWKIKREGRVIETRWGPMKLINRRIIHACVLCSKRWPAFPTATAAQSFYQRKIREKLREGYEVKPRWQRKS